MVLLMINHIKTILMQFYMEKKLLPQLSAMENGYK